MEIIGIFGNFWDFYENIFQFLGVSVKNKPTIGIIGQPFQLINSEFTYNPKIYYSHCQLPSIFYNYQSDLICPPVIPYQLQRPTVDPSRFIITSSCNRQTEELAGYLEGFEPTGKVKIGGAGNKVLQILKGNIDVYFSHKPNSLKKLVIRGKGILWSFIRCIIIICFILIGEYLLCFRWDTCAGEVLLNCFGGQNTDLNGNVYNYGPETTLGNENGNLASLNPTLHTKVLQTWKNKLKPN